MDDIILVGIREEVEAATEIVEQRLKSLGFHLHQENSPKRFTVPVQKWLEGRTDYAPTAHHHSWRNLIGDLKRFLLKDGDRDFLKVAFRRAEFRIPVPDYSAASKERNFVERFRELLEFNWFRRKSRRVSAASLVSDAHWLRAHCEEEFPKLLAQTASGSGFDRKRLLPKLRFLIGKLVYIGSEQFLSAWYPALLAMPELHQQGRVMEAICTRTVDDLLPLGGNVAQAVAQPFSTLETKIIVRRSVTGPVELQALAVLKLNGLDVEVQEGAGHLYDELVRFAHAGSDLALMRSNDPFTRQLACLHGLAPTPRHSQILSTAFDQDDELIFDAIEQLHNSGLS